MSGCQGLGMVGVGGVAIKGLHKGRLCGDGIVYLGYTVYMNLHV